MFSKKPVGIAGRLTVIAVTVSLALVALAVFAYTQLTSVTQAARQTESVRARQAELASATELNITRVSLQLRHAILSRTPRELQETLDDITVKRQAIERAVQDYEATVSTPEDRALFNKLPTILDVFWAKGEANLALITSGQRDAAFAYLVDETIPARNLVLAVLAETVSAQRSALSSEIEGIATDVDNALATLLTLVAASVVTLMLAVAYVGSSLKRRVALASALAQNVQAGNLALNAAVEAARAGTEGRGFAVVASEVRALAQRSASAANEIKGLITASVERVSQGSALVGEAGETMHEIQAAIQRVNDIVGEISVASKEQNTGVLEVGGAVADMDNVTQQNASLVEEMTAAAGSLRTMAIQLVESVSFFRLGGQDSVSPTTKPEPRVSISAGGTSMRNVRNTHQNQPLLT